MKCLSRILPKYLAQIILSHSLLLYAIVVDASNACFIVMESVNTLSNAKWIMFASIFQKLFTFAVNQLLLRSSTPEMVGVVSIQLELLLSTLLFIAREGVRLTTLRIAPTSATQQYIVNLSYIPSALLIVSTIILLLFRSFFTFDTPTLLCYALGALFECLGEPLYNLFNAHAMVTPRLKAESLATSARCLVSYILVVYFHCGVHSFAVAQVCYGVCHFLTMRYYAKLLPSTSYAFKYPSSPTIDNVFSRQYLFQMMNFTGTSIIKHVITEADKITLSMTMTAYHQGVYAVCHNYGSLVARMLYLPIEDAARITFSKLASQLSIIDDHDFKSVHRTLFVSFRSTFRSMLLISILFPLYVPAYVRLLVRLFLGAQWYTDEVVITLSLYCAYLLVLALNGVSEAFVQSVTSNFQRMNTSLILSSIIFAIVAIVSIQLFGTGGIVIANCISMLVRICSNLHYIVDYFNNPSKHYSRSKIPGNACSLSDFLLPISEWLCYVSLAGVTYLSSTIYATSSMSLRDAGVHIGVGVCVFAAVVVVAYRYHRTDIREILTNRNISLVSKQS